jgi:hypothetical protein
MPTKGSEKSAKGADTKTAKNEDKSAKGGSKTGSKK